MIGAYRNDAQRASAKLDDHNNGRLALTVAERKDLDNRILGSLATAERLLAVRRVITASLSARRRQRTAGE